MKNQGFTLIELLVVVLIIGILAAIAVPQYQKAVLKAELHKGISLVESIYQAQQAYYLAHGDFITDFNELDISIPKNESCSETKNTTTIAIQCDFGKIMIGNSLSEIDFGPTSRRVLYVRFIKDFGTLYKAGKRYCWAKYGDKTAGEVCKSMGGSFIGELSGWWQYYQLD